MRIVFDMDGVMADFNLGFHQRHGMEPDEYESVYGSKKFWGHIYGSPDFFSTLPAIPGALKSISLLESLGHELLVLSAPSKTEIEKCTSQKQFWLTRHLNPIPAVFDRDKAKWCKKDSVLIDDRDSNLKPWSAAGGISLKFKTIPIKDQNRPLKLEKCWSDILLTIASFE